MAEDRNNASPQGKNASAVTPDLVRQIADKVYVLWLTDMRIAEERQRIKAGKWLRRNKS